MKSISKLRHPEIRLFGGYVIFAGLATLVDLSLLYFLTESVGIYYLISAALAYLGGMVTNYFLNKVYNFKNKSEKNIQQFCLFAGVALVGLGLNQLILWLLVEFGGLFYMYAKLVTVSVVMFWSFYGHKKLTFEVFK